MNDSIILENSRLNKILEMLIEELDESKTIGRDQPFSWSMKHIFSCSQISKLLALSRGIDIEIAGIAGAIHDLAIIRTGIFENHGPLGGPMVQEFLQKYNHEFGAQFGELTDNEIKQITQATINHTSKKVYSDNAFDELIKDADSLDRYLHGLETYDFYTTRSEKALKDFTLQIIS